MTARTWPSPDDVQAARGGTLPDILGPGLGVVFCGINPSLYSAAVGHHFARPGNRFWRTLHLSGFTPHLLAPEDDRRLTDFGIGVTNLVARATARADELPAGELREGAADLAVRLRTLTPRFVAVAGVSAYRLAFDARGAQVGPQSSLLGGCRVWVLPNPSGINAHYGLLQLVAAYAALREQMARKDRRGSE
ncbi:MAG: G/U mismatch-specific DNA glycosylase [Actinomycetota bacterium]